MAVTISGSHGVYDNVKDTFPQSTSLTGTITKSGANMIVGSGTAFSTELQVGEWLYVAAISEFQQIREITSDTVLYLREQFSGAVSGATPKRIPRQTYRNYSYVIDSAGTAKIDNIELPASTSETKGFIGNISGGKRPNPILIDTTANTNKVYLTFNP